MTYNFQNVIDVGVTMLMAFGAVIWIFGTVGLMVAAGEQDRPWRSVACLALAFAWFLFPFGLIP